MIKIHNVVVGFVTNEKITNFNIDTTLLDNVNDTQNAQAPGADRLVLTPTLQLLTANDAQGNNTFLTVVGWKEGNPYLQHQQTIYSIIGDNMAKQMEESSGDFVVNPFLVTSRSPLTSNQEGEFVNIIIDPGLAYIDGYRVETTSNFNINDEKGTATASLNSHGVSLSYGNYIYVKNLGGTFQYNTGDSVDLYDTAANFYSPANIRSQTLLPGGNKIGTANIRSLVYDSGERGTPAQISRLYIFNVNMNVGSDIRNVKAVYYNGPEIKVWLIPYLMRTAIYRYNEQIWIG